MARASSSEREPLLADQHPDSPESRLQDRHATTAAAEAPSAPDALPRAQFLRAVVVGVLVLVVTDTALVAGELALSALYESALCHNRHPDSSGSLADRLADPRCKEEAVQSDLAALLGWMNMLSMVPGLIMAMPYGRLADRFGPGLVLILMFVGDGLYLLAHTAISANPETVGLWWLYPSSFLMMLGGGGVVYSAMMYTVAGSISTDENRSTIFLYVVAMQYIDNFVTAPMAYLALGIGPIFTIGFSVACFAVATVLTLLMPKLPKQKSKDEMEDEDDDTKDKPWYRAISSSATRTIAAFTAVFQTSFYAGLLLTGVVFSTLGANERDLRYQYAAKKFHWTWGQAGLINTMQSSVTLPVITVLLPSVALLLQKYLHLAPAKKDLWITRGSAVLMVLGSLFQGLAPTPALFVASVGFYELSRGYMPALLSVVAALVGREAQNRVYVCVAMMQAVGTLVAGPLLGQVFALGLGMGEGWYGLPFLVSGGLQGVAMVFTFVVRVGNA